MSKEKVIASTVRQIESGSDDPIKSENKPKAKSVESKSPSKVSPVKRGRVSKKTKRKEAGEKTAAQLRGNRNRNKGHSFERLVAARLKDVFPEAKRHLEFQVQEAKGYDLDNTGRLKIQCKAYKKYAPISYIHEVSTESKTDIPVLVTKGDREKPVAVLFLDDFIDILRDIGVVFEDN